MKIYDLRIKSIDHKRKKQKCNLRVGFPNELTELEEEVCGKEAIAKIKLKTKYTNLKMVNKDIIYLCNDCACKFCKYVAEEVWQELEEKK